MTSPDSATFVVGRAREQSVLRDAVDRARAGRGRLVLIGGEAGIGKTTLVADTARAAAARGTLVLTGHCYELTETPPYGPWLDLFHRASPPGPSSPLPAGLVPGDWAEASSQDALFAKVRDHLLGLATRRPLIVALDDLHWADQASLDLLRFLARQLDRVPILTLAGVGRVCNLDPRSRVPGARGLSSCRRSPQDGC